MKFRIGFTAEDAHAEEMERETPPPEPEETGRRSLVGVRFGTDGRTLSYYNDRFDLHVGDLVYVDGKLEGRRGRVVSVSYNFRIRRSDYKEVIAVADTEVKGELFLAGSHVLAFDPQVIPWEKVRLWYLPPEDGEEIVSSWDGEEGFLLAAEGLSASAAVTQRGLDYYRENRVRYLSVDGTEGRAIVQGTRPYEVGFRYQEGKISGLTCDCYCAYACKHQVAAMFQLREVLEAAQRRYGGRYEAGGYLAALCTEDLLELSVGQEQPVRLCLD